MLAVAGAAVGVYLVTRQEPAPRDPRVVTIDAAQVGIAMGTLELASEPTGADVEVDGQPRGKTPIRVEVTAGDRVIAMALPGRKRFEVRVTVGAGATEVVTGTLPVQSAQLKVASTPDGATVKLAGVDLGRTPLDRDGLTPAMAVMLEVTKVGFMTVREKVDLSAGAVTDRSYTLVPAPRFGKLVISLSVQGVATVYDDRGKKVGRAAPGGAGVITLPVGPQRLKLVSPTLGTTTLEVTITEGATQQKTVAFPK
jgi:hypothetical protein